MLVAEIQAFEGLQNNKKQTIFPFLLAYSRYQYLRATTYLLCLDHITYVNRMK